MIIRKLSDWQEPGDTFSDLERMRSELDSLFGRLTGSYPSAFGAGVFPLMNLTEDKDNVYVRAELPGMKANVIDISATGKSLSISGERKIPPESGEASYHRRERETGSFRRTVTLPIDIDSNEVSANFKDGVLTIVLPKAQASKPKQITVQAA